jgi:hypothetical protein
VFAGLALHYVNMYTVLYKRIPPTPSAPATYKYYAFCIRIQSLSRYAFLCIAIMHSFEYMDDSFEPEIISDWHLQFMQKVVEEDLRRAQFVSDAFLNARLKSAATKGRPATQAEHAAMIASLGDGCEE